MVNPSVLGAAAWGKTAGTEDAKEKATKNCGDMEERDAGLDPR